MNEKKVTFFHQRHGEHKDDDLTDTGRDQVTAGAKGNLSDITVHYVFASKHKRSKQTAEQALSAISHDVPRNIITQDDSFGFSYCENTPLANNYPWSEAKRLVQEERRNDRLTSVDFMLQVWPIGNVVRYVLRCTMKHYAERLAKKTMEEEINVLVGCHGSNGLAALNPETTEGCLNFGDITAYTWSVGNITRTAKLVKSEYLPSGIDLF